MVAGDARPAHVGDVEQLGRDQSRPQPNASVSGRETWWRSRRLTAPCAPPPSSRRELRPISWRCRSVRDIEPSRGTQAEEVKTRSSCWLQSARQPRAPWLGRRRGCESLASAGPTGGSFCLRVDCVSMRNADDDRGQGDSRCLDGEWRPISIDARAVVRA